MFETLFSRLPAIHRHRTGPFAVEREAYIKELADQGTPRATIRIRAHYCLRIASELENWPRDHQFSPAEIGAMADAWAAQSVARGRATTTKNPQMMFRIAAAAFLGSIDRLGPEPTSMPGPYESHIEAFIEEQHQDRWHSAETCRSGRWKVVTFLSYLEDQGYNLESINANHLDAYFQHIAHRLSRKSLRTVASGLRAWFRYCEGRGWTRPGLAEAILLPRLYRHESLPLGPGWDQVSRMISEPGRYCTRSYFR